MTKPEIPKGEDVVEEDYLGTAVQRYMQRPEFSAFERMLCSFLIQSITGNPLEQVIYLCRAAMMLDEERLNLLKIDKQQVESIYTTAQTINTATKRYLYSDDTSPIMCMAVGTLDWDRDVIPWTGERYYAFAGVGSRMAEKSDKLMETGTPREIFNYTCDRLSLPGYENLKADFLRYAMIIVQDYSRKLSNIVSPSTYDEVLKIFHTPAIKAASGVE